MGIHRIAHLLRRALRGVSRRPWLHLLSLVTLSAAFLSFAATLTTAHNLDNLLARWAKAAEITVYVKNDVNKTDLAQLSQAISALKGVARVTSVTPNQAKERFAEELSAYDDLIRTLPESTFPATVEVHLSSELSLDPEGRRSLANRIGQVSMVNEVELYDRWFDRLLAVNAIGQVAAWGLGLIALIVAVLVVAAVIGASVAARQREIEVLRLVGATERYVRFPFLVEGALQGLGAMVFALVVLHFVVNHLQSLTHHLLPLVGASSLLRLGPSTLLLLLAGSAITGIVGARLSLKRLGTV